MKITQKPTKKIMGRYGWRPDIIVNHIAEGGYAGAVSWLANGPRDVSSHFVTSRNGDATQLAPLNMASWCNGTQAYSAGQAYYTGRARNKYVRDRRTNANYFTVSIEHEGWTGKTNGALTEAQYKATLDLHKYIITEIERMYGKPFIIDRNHIIGHVDVAPREKPSCPGKLFPFDRLIRDLRAWRGQSGTTAPQKPTVDKDKKTPPAKVAYTVRINVGALNIRSGPGTNYPIRGCIRDRGVYTIVETDGYWGKLKSGAGWICLAYTIRR